MKVSFPQVYTEPGIDFPFSHLFQKRLSSEVTALVESSETFDQKYGAGFNLIFYVGANTSIDDNKITGPRVFRKAKDVEYSIFLPFDVIIRRVDAPKAALQYLLKGACDVFERLEIDTSNLVESKGALIESICDDPTMLEKPSWDEEENNTHVRKIFEEFFQKKRK